MSLDIAALLAGLDDKPTPVVTAISSEMFGSLLGGLALSGDDIPLPDDEDDEIAPSTIRPKAKNGEGATRQEHDRRYRAKRKKKAISNIAVLDMETDPFDNVNNGEIYPFLAVLYSDNFEPIVIWEEDNETFIDKVITSIESLPDAYTIYAHNGGKFDYMFLMKRLRGRVMFKGRGIMTAEIGKHELRDSYHIIPDRLANFKKDHIDYENMARGKRLPHKNEIISYCISDCKYLLDIVKSFVNRFDFKLSIGQAAMAEIRRHYKFETLSEKQDEQLREYFHGGRVECLQGKTLREGRYNLYDVNSMYPAVMASYQHPSGNVYFPRPGKPTEDTIFLDITCNSRGAFILANADGKHTPHGRHRFKTTIWEYNVAKKHNLISDEEIHQCIDFPVRTDFSKFVLPLYSERQVLKAKKDEMFQAGLEGTVEWDELVKDDMFMKFLLNNGYGKFAQNPRKYKETHITDVGEVPPDGSEKWGDRPINELDDYWVWERPSPTDRFNNVATGASITGAARSELLDAICNSVDPIYCDTDSLICRQLDGVEIDKTKLGAWDMEAQLSEVIICGKKLYGYRKLDGKEIVRAKGAAKLTYEKMRRIYEGETIENVAFGVTLTKAGNQFYMKRRISATANNGMNPNGKSIFWRSAGAGQP